MPDDLIPVVTTETVFLRSQVLAAGCSDRDIARLVRQGVWERIRRGAFVDGFVWRSLDEAERHALRARAVVMQAKTDVVLSHISALPTYGAPTWSLQLDVVHVTRVDCRGGRNEAGVRQHQGVLLPSDVVELAGLQVTSAVRTAIDITTVTGTEASLAIVNDLLHKRHAVLEDIRERYQAMQNHPYTLKTDLVLRLADERIESLGESRTYYLCWRQGLPLPQPQWKVRDHAGQVVARLDFAWPDHKVWLEFDGKEKYLKHRREGESIIDAVLREKRREEMITELTGWRCIRITWADLLHPERTAARIRAMLARTSRVA